MLRYGVFTSVLVLLLGLVSIYVNHDTKNLEKEVRTAAIQIEKNNEELRTLAVSWEYVSSPEYVDYLTQSTYGQMGLIYSSEKSYGRLEDIPLATDVDAFEANDSVGGVQPASHKTGTR